MVASREYREIDIGQVEFTKIQARQDKVKDNVSDIAQSILAQGLFSPILVHESGDGKFEGIAGQRRLLAYRDLNASHPGKFSHIPAFVYNKLDDWEKLAISINENLNQEEMTVADKISAVTACYNKFMDVKITSEKTGIPEYKVRKYVKYVRLPTVLKDLVDDGTITPDIAIEAADTHGLSSPELKEVDPEQLKTSATELQKLTSQQRKKVKKFKKESPKTSVTELIDHVKNKKEQKVRIHTDVTVMSHSKIESYKQKKKLSSVPIAASELIDVGLDNSEI
ncbi:MAG: ParB/RepB/Spo0J family partition protein [Alphaproteobacteria bacterium]|nr:ParB/RepB/Spo0J family partition protein [Alphaproteobacteria bacterium]